VEREAEHTERRAGFVGRYWPTYRDDVYAASRDAAARFAFSNVFSLPDLPGLARLERELREMVSEVMRVPDGGAVTLTSGGTESNFLAVKAARAKGREQGITEPNLVAPFTAHPSFDKAGDELGVAVRRVPVQPSHRADPRGMDAAVDGATIMIVGSAPSYPQGVVDPLDEIAEVAKTRDVWFHVDACVGGFLVPFLIELGEELADFRFDVSAAWSVSADLHKFGYALNGISSLGVRDKTLQELHTYNLPEPGWPFRSYTRVGFAGSRPGGAIASAWTTMQVLGREGYLENARAIRRSGRLIEERVRDIDGLRMMAPPEAGIAAIGVEEGVDPGAISAALLEKGWDIATGLWPPSLHILLDPHPDGLAEWFLADLAEVTATVLSGAASDSRDTTYGDR
jgi:glutamate/tyrosine decarboxylase-like PLP-dependent enzyme